MAVINDTRSEGNEAFLVKLTAGKPFANVTFSDANATVTITESLALTRSSNRELQQAGGGSNVKMLIPNPQGKHGSLKVYASLTGTFDLWLFDIQGKKLVTLRRVTTECIKMFRSKLSCFKKRLW